MRDSDDDQATGAAAAEHEAVQPSIDVVVNNTYVVWACEYCEIECALKSECVYHEAGCVLNKCVMPALNTKQACARSTVEAAKKTGTEVTATTSGNEKASDAAAGRVAKDSEGRADKALEVEGGIEKAPDAAASKRSDTPDALDYKGAANLDQTNRGDATETKGGGKWDTEEVGKEGV
jgi:hypothetical protein